MSATRTSATRMGCARMSSVRTTPWRIARGRLPVALPLAAALALPGCFVTRPTEKPISIYKSEKFETSSQFARRFTSSASTTCEAARRALLSQGYVAVVPGPLRVSARKNFQPARDAHLQIEFTVVCTSENGFDDGPTTVFTTATQDRYTVKMAPGQSASVGSPLGSLSVPLSVSDDSLVKIASETIPAGEFYDRFYKLVEYYIDLDTKKTQEAERRRSGELVKSAQGEPQRDARPEPMKDGKPQ